MSFFGWGNRAFHSTASTTTSNPSSAALLAEIDVNGTIADVMAGGVPFQVSWILGVQTTLATFRLDHATSTVLSEIRHRTLVMVSSGQSAQFITKHTVERADRFRVVLESTVTAVCAAHIIAEPLV